MAHGLLCKNCGWQETDHDFYPEDPDINRVMPGKKNSLVKCRKFVLTREDRAESNRLDKIYREEDQRRSTIM
jgi:hypothetical protein